MSFPNRRNASRFALRFVGAVIPILFVMQGFASVAADSNEDSRWELPSWDSLAVTQRERLLTALDENVTRLGLPFAADWHNATSSTIDDIPAIVPFLYESLRANLQGPLSDALENGQELGQAIANTTLDAAQWLRSQAPHGPENSTLPEPNPDEEQASNCPVTGPAGGLLAVLCLVYLPVVIVLIAVLLVVAVAIIAANLALEIVMPIAQGLAAAAIALAEEYAGIAVDLVDEYSGIALALVDESADQATEEVDTAVNHTIPDLIATYSGIVLDAIHARLDKYANPSQAFLEQAAQLIQNHLGTQFFGGPILQQASWRLPQDNDYSIAWAGQFLYVFGGWKTSDTTHQRAIWRIEIATGQATQLSAQLPTASGGNWLPVYDGQNVYLFGRLDRDQDGQVLRYTIATDTIQPLAPIRETCCTSASFDGQSINLFGHSTGNMVHAYYAEPFILQYDPQTQTVQPTTMPVPSEWSEGTPVLVGQDTYYVGGQPGAMMPYDLHLLPKSHAGSILRYQTRTQNFDVLAVEGYHSTIAPPTFALGTDLYVFDGDSPHEKQDWRVRRIDLATLEATTMATRLPEPLARGLAIWTGTQALIFHEGTVYTYDPEGDSALLDAESAAAAWARTVCQRGQEDAGYQGDQQSCTTPAKPCAQCSSTAQNWPGAPQTSSTIRVAESVHKDPTLIPGDSTHDQDGVPLVLQNVYLPSQARNSTTDQDALSFVDGLPGNGFALLVEPAHRQAHLVVADASTSASNLARRKEAAPLLSASQALDQIEALQGIEARNALAMVLNDDLQVHFTVTSPDVPGMLNLTWTNGVIPADGSWLLVHTDPTRVLHLVLAGNPVSLVERAASHFSPPSATDYRYTFVNVHSDTAFCYDPGTTLAATQCRGSEWPGWIRGFSGQAAYALEALNAGLSSGALPLTTVPPSPAETATATALSIAASPFASCPSQGAAHSSNLGVGGVNLPSTSSTGSSSSSSPSSSTSPGPLQPTSDNATETANQAAGCVTFEDIQDLAENCGDAQWSPSVGQIDQIQDAVMRAVAGVAQNAGPAMQQVLALTNTLLNCLATPTCPPEMPAACEALPEDCAPRVGVEPACITPPCTTLGSCLQSFSIDVDSTPLLGVGCGSVEAPRQWHRQACMDNSIQEDIDYDGDGVKDLTPTWILIKFDEPFAIGDGGTVFPDGQGLLLKELHIKWAFENPDANTITLGFANSNLDNDDNTDLNEVAVCNGGLSNPTNPHSDCRDWDGDGTPNDSDSSPENPNVSASLSPLPPGSSSSTNPSDLDPTSIFNPNAKWSLLGNESYEFPTGIGIDYLPDGMSVEQVEDAMLDNGTGLQPESEPRRFQFQGAYYSTPAKPRNLNHVRLGIEAIDGSPAGQTFLIDGKRLSELLDVREGEGLAVSVDEAHQEGFRFVLRDVNADGRQDMVLHVPHFSQAWLLIQNSQTSGTLEKVKLTSETTGWIVGHGKVFRYASGQLEQYDIPGAAYARNLHVVSDTEFYVVAGGNEYSSNSGGNCWGSGAPSVAHYRSPTLSHNGWVEIQSLSSLVSCRRLSSIWMNSDQSLGYIGADAAYAGSGLPAMMLRYTAGAWQQLRTFEDCAVLADIDLNNAGIGYLAFNSGKPSSNNLESCWHPNAAIVGFDAATPLLSSYVARNIYNVVGVDRATGFAVGNFFNNEFYEKPGIYGKKTDGTFVRTTAPSARYHGVAQQPETQTVWFVGDCYYLTPNSCPTNFGGVLVNTSASSNQATTATGVWRTYDWGNMPAMKDLSFASRTSGLAVGLGVLLFREAKPPVATGTLSATMGDTATTFTANGAGSYAQEPDGVIAHQWSWGDGAVTTSEVSTHRYNSPSSPTYTVTHLVTDTKYNTRASHTFNVTVNSESLAVGQSKSDSFASSSTKAAHHYRIAATTGDRYVQLQLTGPNVASWAIARLDGIAGPTGAWPTSGASASSYYGPSTIAGKIPSNSYLDIKVENLGQGGTGSLAFTISATTLPTPAAPTTSLTAGTYSQVTFSATAPHNGNRLTRLAVDWGDGQTSYYPVTGYNVAGTTYYPSHDYATPGTRTVTLRSEDDVGQVASITRAVTIHLPPQGTTATPTGVSAVQATLNGQLTSLGGASSVTAVYKVFNGGTQIATSTSLSATAVGALPSYTVTGLTSGVSYTFTITLTNDVASITTPPSTFQTASPLVIVPQVVTNLANVALGTTSSLGLKASAVHPSNVAYFVRWDTGGTDSRYITSSEIRYPATGYVPWNQEVTASRILPFVGAHAVEIRMEDALLARSNPTTLMVTVTGASPLASFTSASTTTTSAVISATVGSLGVSPVKLRFGIQDPSSGAWTYNSYADATPGSTHTWTPSLNAAKAYKARIDMYELSDSQSWTTTPAQMITVRTNQAPMLTTFGAWRQVNYLDTARFAVTYADVEGDAPAAAPTMTVNGVTYTLHPSESSAADYRAGVEYHYNLPAANLTQGLTYWPLFQVQDQFARTASAQGGGLNIARKELFYFGFQADYLNALPWGMASGGEPLNYWHVVDTQASNMPGRLALGYHGKALWFGDSGTGTYMDWDGGVPRGTMEIPAVDLGQVVDPALSFSSYYETQDKGTWKDVKLVQACTSNCGHASSWTLLHQVSGDEGGYGAWRTQHVNLAQYAGQVVQLRFVFDAIDNTDNAHFGWFIDDITVGHDHDDDALPDVLEESRHDILIAEQPVALKVQSGGTAASYVRRLVRPFADSFQLEALVASSQPSSLTVVVGVTPSVEDVQWHNFTLYSEGVDHSSCTTAPDNGVETFNRSAVVNRGDGLDIRIDLVTCAALFSSIPEEIFAEPRNWFLQVTNNGAGIAWIDLLRIVTSGRTDEFQFDTNQDASSDGMKVNERRDPLGHDADQDGIVNAADPDDTVPSWAPALEVESEDFETSMELSFHDLAVPLSKVTVQAHYLGAAANRDLGSTYQGGARWTVNPSQYGQLPDLLNVTWRDVYGTTGVVTYHMPPPTPEEPIYQPGDIEWKATDAASGSKIVILASLDRDAGGQMSSVVMSTTVAYPESPWPDDWDGWEGMAVAGVVAIGAGVAAVALAPVVAVAAVVGIGVVGYLMYDAWASSRVTASDGAKVTVHANLAGATGLSDQLIRDTIKHGTKIQLPGDTVRYTRDVGGVLTFVTVTKGWAGRAAQDAWQWTLPAAGGPLQTPAIGNILAWERAWAILTFGAVTAEALKSMPAHSRANPDDCTVFVPVDLHSSGTSEEGFAPEINTVVPKCAHDAWLQAMKSTKTTEDYLKARGFTDTGIAQYFMGFTASKANQGQFEGGLFWYWDDIPSNQDTDVNCGNPATWIHPDIRRCSRYNVTAANSVDWQDLPVRLAGGEVEVIEEKLNVTRLDWKQPGRSVKYNDGLAGKGSIMDFQKPNFGGNDVLKGYLDSMEFVDEEPSMSGLETMVKVPYHVKTSGSEFYINYENLA